MAERILIVDDDPDICEAMRLVLETREYEVTVAHDPDSGLQRVAEGKPALIILDVMMPEGTEGFHFVWTLRGNPDKALADTPILMVTAIHDQTKLRFYPERKDGTYASGEYLPVQGFVDKPVTPEDLLDRVEEALGR